MRKSEKGDYSAKYSKNFTEGLIRFIYTLNTILISNIMILAQTVLQIFVDKVL